MAKKQLKVFNVCVTGLSGYDIQEKHLFGVGKSCLCNRIVRPAQDDYDTDHHSVFSTSDFVGSVLNNDHFLYWGKTEKCFDDSTKIIFKLIEQTEFIDDASYAPLSKGGTLLPYVKRATATKLLSPGKLMYISRDQVALQSEFDQVHMDGEGKFQVDGFICVYDVSSAISQKLNYIDLQEEVLSNLLSHITKAKKPVVIVATKCDDCDESILQRAHNFASQRKIHIPIVECSADEVVNIDLILQTLWHLTETKNKFRPKIVTYQEGFHIRKEIVGKYDKKYLSLVKSAATDSSLLMSWSQFKLLNENSDTYQEYIAACGSVKARTIFNQQAKKIRKHYEDKKLNEFLNKLPEALDELLPSIQSIEANDWKWENCQRAIKNHLLFNKWFKILPTGISWTSPDQLFDASDTRIPFDVLQVERSRACFDRHYKKLRESARKLRMKNEFQKLLELTTDIKPGTSWPDASQIISNEESYKYLVEMERKEIFETYLREITDIAKNDFQELLFESANKFSILSKDARPSVDEIREINEYLQDDDRYKNLENLGNARDIQLFNHIALMQSPNRCLSGPEKCMDRLIQEVVKLTESR